MDLRTNTEEPQRTIRLHTIIILGTGINDLYELYSGEQPHTTKMGQARLMNLNTLIERPPD